MKKLLLSLLMLISFASFSQSYVPLINNISPVPKFNGYNVSLGETADHFNYKPLFTEPVLLICMGASTPGQIGDALVAHSSTLSNVTILNCCVGSEDVNKWLVLTGNGWTNVKSVLTKNGYSYGDVDGIIMCNDDLRDQSVLFPGTPNSLAAKVTDLISLCRTQFVNLQFVTLESRLCEYKITDTKFVTPTGYYNGWANKFVVEYYARTGHRINGVWVTDADAYLWTNGEITRSDGFSFKFAWMKQRQTSVHLDTKLQGDDIIADYILNRMAQRYIWFF